MNGLVHYDRMRTAIIEARDIDDVKDIRDKAEALRQYAKQAGESLENQNMIAEIKLRAERRAGELLAEMPKQAGARGIGINQYTKTEVELQPVTPPTQTLTDLGISKAQSSRWQAIASLPEQVFEAEINQTKAEKKELTSAGLVRVARKKKREDKAKQQATRKPEPALRPVACRLVVADACATTLEPESVDIIITSPPYNLGAEEWPMGGEGRSTRDGIDYISHGDNLPQSEYERWQVDVLREMYRVAKPGASFFYNHKVRTAGGEMIHPMRWLLHPDNPWTLRQEIIWDRKSTHNHSATLFWPEDERIYWMTKGKPIIRSQSIGQSTVWSEFGPVPSTWHPAPFTEKLPRMLLEAIGVDVETTVLDPFAGSCTTLKVAVEMGCQGVGVDISREYLERAIVENGWSHECLYYEL